MGFYNYYGVTGNMQRLNKLCKPGEMLALQVT
jgi:hypothetical protein